MLSQHVAARRCNMRQQVQVGILHAMHKEQNSEGKMQFAVNAGFVV
jgi:hypothetical protein